MNTNITRFASVVAVLSALLPAVGVNARSGVQTPTYAIVSDNEPFVSKNELVSGVLGFDDQCGYALYADRRSAAEHDLTKSLLVGKPEPDAIQIGHGIDLDQIIGRYVYTQGDIRYAPESALRDMKVSSIYSFEGKAGTSVPCEVQKSGSRFVRAATILKNWEPYGGHVVETVGLMTSSAQGLVLMTDLEAARAGAPNQIILHVAPSEWDLVRSWRTDQVWVVATGRVVGPKIRGREVTLEDAKLRLVESIDKHDSDK